MNSSAATDKDKSADVQAMLRKAETIAAAKRASRPVFSRGAFQFAETAIMTYQATAPDGMTVEDLADPAVYAYKGLEFRPGDIVRVRPDDGSWWAEVLIADAMNGACIPIVLRSTETPRLTNASRRGVLEKYDFKREANGQFTVVRKLDQVLMGSAFSDLNAAEQYILNHATERL